MCVASQRDSQDGTVLSVQNVSKQKPVVGQSGTWKITVIIYGQTL